MNFAVLIRSIWIFLIAHLTLCVVFLTQTNSATNGDASESGFSSLRRRNLLEIQRSSAKKDQDDICLFSGKRYSIGQKWQHILDPSTANICVSCACHQAGKVTCESNYCSDLNCEDDEPDECCQICGDDDVTSSDQPSSWSNSNDDKEIPCFHDGRKIWDGQIFSSNSTGIQKTRSDQCVQCVCQSGMVLCRLKICLNSDCPSPVYVADDCCPTCPGQGDILYPSDPNLQEVDERTKGCLSGGHQYSDGEQWHPVIGPFGQMDCVLCQCQKGKIDCNRLSCPEAPPCARPRQIPGQCCPVCPGDVTDDKKGNNCFPQSTDTIVYKDFTEELYQFAFKTTDGQMKLVTLTLKEDRTLKFSEQSLSSKEFTNKIQSGKFEVVGTTKSRLAQRFERKAKRLSERCANRCEKRIERLENALKLKQIDQKCAKNL